MTGRAALVTGLGHAIAPHVATSLAGAGWFVHLQGNASSSDHIALAARIRGDGGDARAVPPDHAERERPDDLIADCRENGPPLTALVGIALPGNTDGWRNLDATPRRDMAAASGSRMRADLARAFADGFPEGQGGCLVNIVDARMRIPGALPLPDAAAAASLDALTRELAMALAPAIRVCAIGVPPLPATPDFHADVARSLRFILDSPCLTGQTILLDSGRALFGREPDGTAAGFFDREDR